MKINPFLIAISLTTAAQAFCLNAVGTIDQIDAKLLNAITQQERNLSVKS